MACRGAELEKAASATTWMSSLEQGTSTECAKAGIGLQVCRLVPDSVRFLLSSHSFA